MRASACRLEPRSSVRRPPIRSHTQPDARRLTTPKPSMSDSIWAPRATPWPRSPQYATMWTWGIDMATQQLRPAMTSTVCSAAGDIPSGREDRETTWEVADGGAVSGEPRRRVRARGSITATQKTAIPR